MTLQYCPPPWEPVLPADSPLSHIILTLRPYPNNIEHLPRKWQVLIFQVLDLTQPGFEPDLNSFGLPIGSRIAKIYIYPQNSLSEWRGPDVGAWSGVAEPPPPSSAPREEGGGGECRHNRAYYTRYQFYHYPYKYPSVSTCSLIKETDKLNENQKNLLWNTDKINVTGTNNSADYKRSFITFAS